jgi:hypothetical protein
MGAVFFGKGGIRMMAGKEQVASRPPMGWNSWDSYAAAVTQAQLLANAAYMRDHLLAYGWEYVVCDIQWAEPLAGTSEGEYRPMAPLCMDEYGRLIPAENRFPSSAGGQGFGPVAEKIHGTGLKFGIRIMRGLPRQAAYARLPVKGARQRQTPLWPLSRYAHGIRTWTTFATGKRPILIHPARK